MSGTSEAAEAAAIVSDAVQLGLNRLQHVYDLAQDDTTTWDADLIVNEATDLVAQVKPVVTRSIDLALGLLRPWAKAFSEQVSE